MIFLCHCGYLLAAYRNPGYVSSSEQLKKSFSTTSNPVTPNSNEIEERNDALPSSNSECPDIFIPSSQDLNVTYEAKSYLRRSDQHRLEPYQNFLVPFQTEGKEIRKTHSLSVNDSPFKSDENLKDIDEVKSMDSPVIRITEERNKEDEFVARYCTVCNNDQPIRAKHCMACNKCVHRYDHHCTWLGNCIGERNHMIYYGYLLFQNLELILVLYFLVNNIQLTGIIALNVTFIILIIPIEIFAGFLFALHTYLIVNGITTWELISWKKISYLGERTKSPFSSSIALNLFRFSSSIEIRDWNQFIFTK